jgi:flavin reductase (DIM6/NTAB) family NADH-FMN oxidoreductase RutF
MTDDTAATANSLMAGLRPFPVAITTVSQGRTNGLMSLSAGSAGIIDEAPRFQFGLTKYNFTHDLVVESGIAAMHFLAADPEALDDSLAILMGLGGSSGRDGDKLGPFRTKDGVTGVPILLDALGYVEGRVVHSVDNDENTVFICDVVASEKLRSGPKLNIGTAWGKLPKEWTESYERNHIHQTNDARRRRGLPELTEGH